MSNKKTGLFLMIALLSFSTLPLSTMASPLPSPTAQSNEVPETPANVKILLTRLDQIKDMDKSKLSGSEKKALRKEVRAIKSELNSAGSGGIYLSAGAVIIIIILLIILL